MTLNIAVKRITGREWFEASSARVQTMARQIARQTRWPSGANVPAEVREDWAAGAVAHLFEVANKWERGDWHDWAYRVMQNHIKNACLSDWRKHARTEYGINDGDETALRSFADVPASALVRVSLDNLADEIVATHYEQAQRLIEQDLCVLEKLKLGESKHRQANITDYQWRESTNRLRQALKKQGVGV